MNKLLFLFFFFAMSSFAAEFEGTTSKFYIKRTVNSDEVQKINTELKSDIYEIIRTYRYERRLHRVPYTVCTGGSGNGSRGNWHGFYNVPYNQKAKALAKAIKGVGPATAPKLVSYFTSRKPRSWESFSRVIKNAESRISNGLAHRVLSQYGSDNMRNLGYYSQTSCEVRYRDEYVIERVEYVKKEYVRTEKRNIDIVVEGGVLIDGEVDSFSITFDGFRLRKSSNARYNDYHQQSFDEDGMYVSMHFIGVRTYKYTPKNNVFVQASINSDGKFKIEINDSGFNELYANNNKLIVSLYRSINFWPDKAVEKDITISLSGKNQIEILDVNLPKKGKKYYVSYRVLRLDSAIYKDKKSSSKDSSKILYK